MSDANQFKASDGFEDTLPT